MEQRFEKMFENEAFKAIGEEKTQILKEFVQNNQGKNANEIFTNIIKLNSILNKGNPLTEKEKEAIFDVILATLNDNERKKFISLLNIIEKGF